MSPLQRTHANRFTIARLGSFLLALVILLPGQPIHAAAASAQARALPPRPQPPASPTANHAPVAHDDSLVAFANQDFQRLYMLDNDTDVDGDPLNIFSFTPPLHGDYFRNQTTVDYTPFTGFSGTDSFKYTVEDPSGAKSTATVTVTVVPPGGTGTASNRFAISACGTYVASCDTSIWTVSPYSGATGDTASGACNGASGLGVEDANMLVFDRVNAFDTGLTLWVNGQQLTPRLPMTVTHYSLVSGPISLGGVRVTMHYDGLLGSDTLRTQVIFSNVSGSTKTFTATLASNLGSNGHTTIIGSSSGDTAFTTSDRWLVTSTGATNPSGIVSTNVLFGPGAPAVTSGAVYTSTFTCNEFPAPNDEGVRADFHMVVPAGTVQRLLFFTQAHENNADAVTDAAVFDGEPVGLLSGLTNGQLAQVVNWDLSPILRVFLPALWR